MRKKNYKTFFQKIIAPMFKNDAKWVFYDKIQFLALLMYASIQKNARKI